MTKVPRNPYAALPSAETDYEVGYGKPPESNQFAKGKSGNPRGRPKGSTNKAPRLNDERLKAIILDETYRGITIREGDRTLTVPMAQAVMRAIAHNAVKGKHFSQRLFAQLVGDVETANFALNSAWFEKAIEYKVEWERELERRRRSGISDLPAPLPNPDHIVLDVQAGTARIIGPATREEQAIYENVIDEFADLLWLADELKQQVAETRRGKKKQDLELTLQNLKARIPKYQELLPTNLQQDAKARAARRHDEYLVDPEVAQIRLKERQERRRK